MRLKAVILKNFRGYNDYNRIEIEPNLTSLIGRNDAGKSTVLEALEIFFNSDQIKIDKSDLCVYSTDSLITIGCIFTDLPEHIVIDATNTTSLEAEHLVNEDGDLEIHHVFDGSKKSPSATVIIRALHPSAQGVNDLLLLKQDELKKRIRARGIDEATIPDLRSNACLRKALWDSVADLEAAITDIPVSKEDAKAIWDTLSKHLPVYALFKSDRGSSDEDDEVQDPMKLAVNHALKQVQAKLDQIKDEVKAKAIEVAQRTLDKLRELDHSLAAELTPDFKKEPDWKSLFKLSLACDDGISINKRGSGARRLILLSFFSAEAERRKAEKNSPNIIYAIEEPETSQHPNNQEMLIRSLLKLSMQDNCQVLLTTHVPALAGLLPLESLRFIEKESPSSAQVQISAGDEATFDKIATALGVLPDKMISTANALIMVEGAGDVVFLQHISNQLKLANIISQTLADRGVVPIISGGCGNLKHWINLQIIQRLNRPWGVLLDSDDEGNPNSKNFQENQRQIADLRAKGITAFTTKKREPENYLHPDVIAREKGVNVTFTDHCDAKAIIGSATKTRASEVLEKFWTKMTVQEIIERGAYTDHTGQKRNELIELIAEFLRLAGAVVTVNQDAIDALETPGAAAV